jgi:precorrin-2 dehydrogenase/sirohydrochlorin ferrochelatase
MSVNPTAVEQTFESFYPINLKLKGKRVLMVGGSFAAFTQTSKLVAFGALVDVVASHMVPELPDLAVVYGDRVTLHKRSFDQSDSERLRSNQYALVFAFANEEQQNQAVVKESREAKVLVYALDDTEHSDYVLPSVLKRGHLKICVSTDAISPPLERAVKQRIEAIFVSEIDNYTLFLTSMQELIQSLAQDESLSQPAVFRSIRQQLAESEEILLALQRKNFEEANHLARLIVSRAKSESDTSESDSTESESSASESNSPGPRSPKSSGAGSGPIPGSSQSKASQD